jgi:hypothetical protein
MTTPSTPPIADTTRLSVTSWRTMRPRPAPSAARIASSLWRAVPRASCRCATLTHAISRTSPTAASSVQSAGRTSSKSLSSSGTSVAVWPLFVSGYWSSSCRSMPTTSARACATVAPGASRASRRAPVWFARLSQTFSAPWRPIGRYMWTGFGKKPNPRAVTPTIV